MNWWHHKTYYPVLILPTFFTSSFIYEYHFCKKESISGISGILSSDYVLSCWCKRGFPRTDTSKVLSRVEAVWTKVPASKICPKNFVSKFREEKGILEIILCKEEADDLGWGWGRLSLKLSRNAAWAAFQIQSWETIPQESESWRTQEPPNSLFALVLIFF